MGCLSFRGSEWVGLPVIQRERSDRRNLSGVIMYYVYIITNKNNTVLYTGVTNDLQRRIYEHKNGINEGFTKKYRIHKLVYFETFSQIEDAIAREKQIKAKSRNNKERLINSGNPEWTDLSAEW